MFFNCTANTQARSLDKQCRFFFYKNKAGRLTFFSSREADVHRLARSPSQPMHKMIFGKFLGFRKQSVYGNRAEIYFCNEIYIFE